jgi:hypothetical protein
VCVCVCVCVCVVCDVQKSRACQKGLCKKHQRWTVSCPNTKEKGEGFATDRGLQFLNGRASAEKCNEENASELSLRIPSPILNVHILIKTPSMGGREREGRSDGRTERVREIIKHAACTLLGRIK